MRSPVRFSAKEAKMRWWLDSDEISQNLISKTTQGKNCEGFQDKFNSDSQICFSEALEMVSNVLDNWDKISEDTMESWDTMRIHSPSLEEIRSIRAIKEREQQFHREISQEANRRTRQEMQLKAYRDELANRHRQRSNNLENSSLLTLHNSINQKSPDQSDKDIMSDSSTESSTTESKLNLEQSFTAPINSPKDRDLVSIGTSVPQNTSQMLKLPSYLCEVGTGMEVFLTSVSEVALPQ